MSIPRVVVSAVSILALACAGASTADDGTGEETAASAETGASESDSGASSCADVCGTEGCGACPAIVDVALTTGSIGAHEVSGADYLEFLAVEHDLGSAPASCAWNDTFEPTVTIEDPTLPVTGVDWCDAEAFCRWTGRSLCGAPGGGPGALADANDPAASAWFEACSAGGTRAYPYGDTYDGAACNGVDAAVGSLVPSGSVTACEGGVPGAFDLSGNAWEWTDACTGEVGADDECLRRGGSHFSDMSTLRCAVDSRRPRSHADDHTGIRCCTPAP